MNILNPSEMVHVAAVLLAITFIITATIESGECCVETVNASAASPNATGYLTTPGYPTGVSTSYDCVWVINPIGKGRIRVELELDVAASTCDDANVTFRDGAARGYGLEDNTWCPGQPNIYQSLKGALNISFSLSAGRSLRIKYTALEESSCVRSLNVTDKIETITTPAYPNAFPSFTDCRWTFPQLHQRIQIEITHSDIKGSSGCSADVVSIVELNFKDKSLSRRVSSKCNNSVPVTYITASFYTVVSFKAWRVNHLNKGLVFTVRKISNEPCGGNLTASSVPQTFHSPGYPEYEPNLGLCLWTLQAENPSNVVQVKLESKLRRGVTCSNSQSYVGVIDGSGINQHLFHNLLTLSDPKITGTDLMALVCHEDNRTLRSFADFVTVYYRSLHPMEGQGFLINYMEVPGNFTENRKVRAPIMESFALISPRFPDGQVRNADITWTITADLTSNGYLVLLDIYDTDLGDGSNCNENNIKVYDGNTTTSPLLTTLCGKEVAAFFKPVLLISFKTDSNLGRKGFRSKFQSEKYSCNKSEVNLFTNLPEKAVMSFNYPGNYPVDLPCSYIVRAEEQSNYINIYIQNLEFDCDAGCLEIFDGANNTAPVLLKTCGKETKSIDSGHNVVFVSVVSSNTNPVGKGFRIVFTSTNRVPVGLIVGVAVGAVGFVGLAALAAFLYRRRMRRAKTYLHVHDTNQDIRRKSRGLSTQSERKTAS